MINKQKHTTYLVVLGLILYVILKWIGFELPIYLFITLLILFSNLDKSQEKKIKTK